MTFITFPKYVTLNQHEIYYYVGPLTHTSDKGITTLIGVVRGAGNFPNCMSTGLYTRVSDPNAFEWIIKYIKKYEETSKALL